MFLHGEIEERRYMKHLKGTFRKVKKQKICLLKKSLYGLKQTLR